MLSFKSCRAGLNDGSELLVVRAVSRLLLTDTKPFIGLLGEIVVPGAVLYPELLFYFGNVAVECVLFDEPES